MNEINIAHKVTLEPELEDRFDHIGREALLALISNDVDHSEVLDHIQALRAYWTFEGLERNRAQVIRRYMKPKGLFEA